MRSKSQILSKLRADGHITDEEYKLLEQEPCDDATLKDIFCMGCEYKEQEPKTGYWIAEENEEMETIGYFCSECDLPMETKEKTRFCPNCGAKMEVSE